MRATYYLTSSQLATRWGVHRSTVLRIMRRYAVATKKFGETKTAPRRFSADSVTKVEALAGYEP